MGVPAEFRELSLWKPAVRGPLIALPFLLLLLWRPRFIYFVMLLFGCVTLAAAISLLLLPVYRRGGLLALIGLATMALTLGGGGWWLQQREDARIETARNASIDFARELRGWHYTKGSYPAIGEIAVPDGLIYMPTSGAHDDALDFYVLLVEDRYAMYESYWYWPKGGTQWLYRSGSIRTWIHAARTSAAGG